MMSAPPYRGTPHVAHVRAASEVPLPGRLLMVARGLWAVALLLLSAAAAVCSAVASIPPGRVRALGHVIADEYRAGRAGAIDALVVQDDQDDRS